jgi:GntR family transcriptional regulator, carbon starvation induced regulator
VGDVVDILEIRDKPATLASAVHERIREDILSATLLPGEKLRMEALRERYEVGGSPLREALNRLVAEGLVTQEDQKGFRVSSVSIDELQELTRTRRLINETALREAIRNGDAAWEEGILLAYHRMMRGHAAKVQGAEREKLHREFHRAIIAGCASRQLMQFSHHLFEQARRYQMLSISPAATPRDGHKEHRLIMEAVLARDLDRAVLLLNEHVNLTERLVLELNSLTSVLNKQVAGKRQS